MSPAVCHAVPAGGTILIPCHQALAAHRKLAHMKSYDLTNLNDLLECQVKLRGSLDERMVIWWIRATQYAVVDTVLTPLYHLLNASFQQFRRIDDNAYAISMLELAYFTDLESNEPLSEFTNPFTHETGSVPPAMFGPNSVSLTTDGLQPPEHFPFGTLTFDGRLGPGYTDDNDVWIREDTLVRMTSANPAFGNYIYNELVTYRGDRNELNNPDALCAEAAITYNTTSNWRPWMMPGDTPGHIMSEGYGKKVSSVDELPADYLAMARRLDPEVIADPEKILTAPPPAPSSTPPD
jgi:hypothetical protein